MLHVEADSLAEIDAQMLELARVGRVAPGSVWVPVWRAPEPDAIAVVDSQHGDLIDP